MINPHCFQLPWLQAQKERLGVRDVGLLERCIHALELVARLRHAGLDFIFKGGTSLVLHLQPLRRLSIDVDIACDATLEQIKRALDAVVYTGQPFNRYEHQAWRDRDEPPTMHFQVFFNSVANLGTVAHILLDVLFEKSIYPELMEKELAADFVLADGSTRVCTPTVDCLLGDKLAAFAPGTIGVPYEPPATRAGASGDPQHTRVAKQLYDVSELFAIARNLDAVRQTHENIFEAQNRYRGHKHTLAETLLDTIDAAYWFSQRDLKHGEKHTKSDFLHQGILNLDSHLLGNGLKMPAAKAAAARAACLAAMLLGNSRETLDEIRNGAKNPLQTSGNSLVGKYERLKSLRKIAPEAYYYWSIACGYLGG